MIEQLEIDALFQRFLGSGIEDVHHHLVEQGFLIDIPVADDFLHRLAGLGESAAVVPDNEQLRHGGGIDLGELGFKRRIALAMGKIGVEGTGDNGVAGQTAACGGVDVFLQKAQRLVQLQVARRLVERPVLSSYSPSR